MGNGRYILWLGVLAAAGLVSVRDGQEQLRLGYESARTEDKLRTTRRNIVTERARLQTLRAPAQVVARIKELRLDLAPPSPLSPYAPEARAGASPMRGTHAP